MILESNKSEAPEIVRIETVAQLRFAPKHGTFQIYNRETKESIGTKEEPMKSVKIIPISDGRFTVQQSESEKGINVWAGTYRSPKQTITILKKVGEGSVEKYLQGTWAEIKEKTSEFKYVSLVHCLVEVGGKFVPGVFELKGTTGFMWSKAKGKGDDGVMTLTISDEKTYKTGKYLLYEFSAALADMSDEQLAQATEYGVEVKASYDSEDARYKFYKDSKSEDVDDSDEPEVVEDEEVDPSEIDF